GPYRNKIPSRRRGNYAVDMSKTVSKFDPPRWSKCPPICVKENLPALASEPQLKSFLESNGPRCNVHRVWLCKFCGHWHAKTSAPDPSGPSSGNTRTYKHADD